MRVLYITVAVLLAFVFVAFSIRPLRRQLQSFYGNGIFVDHGVNLSALGDVSPSSTFQGHVPELPPLLQEHPTNVSKAAPASEYEAVYLWGCEIPREFLFSRSVLELWFQARSLLSIETRENTCDEIKTLVAYLNGDPKLLGFQSKAYGGVLHTPRGSCTARWKGNAISYVRVYKSGNNAICANLEALDDGSNVTNPDPIIVSWVRDPLSHFIAGYSEISFRASMIKAHPDYASALYTFERCQGDDLCAARNFVSDFVAGRLHRVHDITDAHCFPQVAFLTSDTSLAYIGTLEKMRTSWEAFGTAFSLKGWPEFKPDLGAGHIETDARSHNVARVAMEELLETGAYLEVMCRVLLPDYVCFGFPLPAGCGNTTAFNTSCPYAFPKRSQ